MQDNRPFEARLRHVAQETATALDQLLPKPEIDGVRCAEARLFEAMRYACEGGKRMRAFLVVESATIFGVDHDASLRVAAAVEAIHAYSLIHDDLPAMDDDDLRRGRPTTHKEFDEATAILAGDALQAFAFSVVVDAETHENPFVRCSLLAELAKAAGGRGMVGGQMIDIEAERAEDSLSMAETSRLQRLKTGALIEFSCVAGGILGGADKASRRALEGYARDFGLAFQIHDDLIDATGDAEMAGKAIGKDADAGKATFVDLLGVKGAQDRADLLIEQSKAHLAPLGKRAAALVDLANFAADRRA